MPIRPELNVSGYRGIWGKTLTEQIVRNYTKAFALFTKEETKKVLPSILIGRDGRETGPEIKKIIIDELLSSGVKIIDGDIMPTPTVLFSVRKHSYDGAIIITASHNPIEYNGLKFVNDKALFTIKDEVVKINKYYHEDTKEKVEGSILEQDIPNFSEEHANHIIKNINVEKIRERKFKVVSDMINASACVLDPYLFEKLGVELVPVNNIPSGKFAHKPEPLKENLLETEKIVKESGADLGFVHDPDADRLVIIDENGETVLEEYSLALSIENILSKNQGKPIVINLSTSQTSADLAKKYGSKCFRSKIGEGNVVEKMIEQNAIIGGEGNGGVIYPTINTVRDSFTGLSLILELLAERGKNISELVNELPRYFIKKDKWEIIGKNLEEIYHKLKSTYKNTKIDEQDGLRLDFPDGSWIHLRPSNTEPVVRLFGEAKTEKRINSLFNEVKLTL